MHSNEVVYSFLLLLSLLYYLEEIVFQYGGLYWDDVEFSLTHHELKKNDCMYSNNSMFN